MSKALFLTRIQPTTEGSAHRFVVQVFDGVNINNRGQDDQWKIIFAGTEDECKRFTINAHHAITPNMANAEVVLKPKRIMEP